MAYVPPVVQGLLIALVTVAMVYDIRSRRIPNWLILAGLIVGLSLNAFLYELAGLRFSLLGIGAAALVYLPFFVLRAIGAGDVKLMLAIGSMIGPVNWLITFILTAVSGGLIALTLLIARGRLAETLRNLGFILLELSRLRAPYLKREQLDVTSAKANTLPHAVSIAIGSIAFVVILTVQGGS